MKKLVFLFCSILLMSACGGEGRDGTLPGVFDGVMAEGWISCTIMRRGMQQEKVAGPIKIEISGFELPSQQFYFQSEEGVSNCYIDLSTPPPAG